MSIAITTRLSPTSYTNQLRADVRSGLTGSPKSIPPKYFYDGRGSALFDQITKLPEYYPTRAERSILAAHARDIAILTRAQTLTELGSGTSDKTRLLLDALHRGGPLRRFEPFDVDPDVLAGAGAAVAADYPGLEVRGVVGDFQHHLGLQSGGGRRLIAFLGSTIGNFLPTQRAQFLTAVRSALGPGDSFLLGTDLVKDQARLVAAYDDAAGVTAAFNRNVLVVLNRELGADFDVHGFDHVARWDAEQEWIEMRLRSTRSQTVHLADLNLDVSFHAGEAILTEISVKFRRETVQDELSLAGLQLERWWTDPAGDFALSLYRPR